MKRKIAVLFGGCSPEYDISLESAYSVLKNIDEKYEVIPIGITRTGEWFKYVGSLESLLNDTWHKEKEDLIPAVISPDRNLKGMIEFRKEKIVEVKLDAVFPVLHGRNGEDGTVQGLIELAGIKLIGCGSLCSSLSMDKDRAHRMVKTHGIKVPKGIVVKAFEIENIEQYVDHLNYPLFIKPLNAGSSFGISKIEDSIGLKAAVGEALRFSSEVIIEENVEGFEVGCGVIGNDQLIMGIIDEIELTSGFLDYEDKYVERKAIVHNKARIDEETEIRIKEAAKTIYKALNCKGFTRVDMFLTPKKEILFNEVNTIPGFTKASRFSNMMGGIGMSFKQVIESIIQLGLENE